MAHDDGSPSQVSRSSVPRVSPAWLSQVRKELESRGWNRRKLAKEAGFNESNISRLFKFTASPSIVDKVATILGLPDPYGSSTHDEDEEFSEYIRISLRMRRLEPARFSMHLESIRKWDDAMKAFARVEALADPTK